MTHIGGWTKHPDLDPWSITTMPIVSRGARPTARWSQLVWACPPGHLSTKTTSTLHQQSPLSQKENVHFRLGRLRLVTNLSFYPFYSTKCICGLYQPLIWCNFALPDTRLQLTLDDEISDVITHALQAGVKGYPGQGFPVYRGIFRWPQVDTCLENACS